MPNLIIILSFLTCSFVFSLEYFIVADLGSTGSRSYVYESANSKIIEHPAARVSPGLSAMVSKQEEEVPSYIWQLFRDALNIIPSHRHNETDCHIKATAGMRLISTEKQRKLFNLIHQGLISDPRFPFQLLRENVGLISGDEEAYYGALATNFLAGKISDRLSIISTENMRNSLLGALDLGGSSTQITIPIRKDFHTEPSPPGKAFSHPPQHLHLSSEDFWMHSFLSYGVVTVREQYLNSLVLNSASVNNSRNTSVKNPCGFQGHILHHAGTTLIGTGEALKCVDGLRKVLAWENIAGQINFRKDMPETTNVNFYGMAVFYYALDCVKAFTYDKTVLSTFWPNPTLGEIMQASSQFCQLTWEAIRLHTPHVYTSVGELPFRCLEVNYIFALLHYGYGFSTSSRQITYALEINGMDAEWTLGYALALQTRPNFKKQECILMDSKQRFVSNTSAHSNATHQPFISINLQSGSFGGKAAFLQLWVASRSFFKTLEQKWWTLAFSAARPPAVFVRVSCGFLYMNILCVFVLSLFSIQYTIRSKRPQNFADLLQPKIFLNLLLTLMCVLYSICCA